MRVIFSIKYPALKILATRRFVAVCHIIWAIASGSVAKFKVLANINYFLMHQKAKSETSSGPEPDRPVSERVSILNNLNVAQAPPPKKKGALG